MTYEPVSFREKFGKFSERFQPKVIAQMNDYQFKLARVEGEFVWHSHADTDELFLVLKGELTMYFRDRTEVLKPGEFIVVPRGTEHKPAATGECQMMVMDAEGTSNTGDVTDANLTRETLEKI